MNDEEVYEHAENTRTALIRIQSGLGDLYVFNVDQSFFIVFLKMEYEHLEQLAFEYYQN